MRLIGTLCGVQFTRDSLTFMVTSVSGCEQHVSAYPWGGRECVHVRFLR